MEAGDGHVCGTIDTAPLRPNNFMNEGSSLALNGGNVGVLTCFSQCNYILVLLGHGLVHRVTLFILLKIHV